MSKESAMEKVDVMAAFFAALADLGPHMEAVGRLCSTAVGLQRWGTSMDLQVHGLTRDEYDGFDGEDRYFAPTEQRANPFWSKKVTVYNGATDLDVDPTCEGGITFTLYTDFAPVTEPVALRHA